MLHGIWQTLGGLVDEMLTYKSESTAKAVAIAVLKATYIKEPPLRGRAANGRFSLQYADEDTPDYIDFCLNHCPYATTECCNCLDTAGRGKRGRPRKLEYV